MTPNEATQKLNAAGWTDREIAAALGVNLTTIWRIRTRGQLCEYSLGAAIVAMAQKPAKKHASKAA